MSLSPSAPSLVRRAPLSGKLAGRLEQTCDDLAELYHHARQLRGHPQAFSTSHLAARKLDTLIAKTRAGAQALSARMHQLTGDCVPCGLLNPHKAKEALRSSELL